MGLLLEKHMGKGCKLGLWETTEDYDDLKSHLDLEKNELNTLESYRNYERKIEFLSVRTLLTTMLDPSARIIYNGDHKPFLKDKSFNISITHSYKLTSILLSKNNRVGIDMEYMSDKINRISHKFIHTDEYITENRKFRNYHMYIHWCAKEVLYKLCDKPSLNFRENLIIKPFEISDKGSIHGEVQTMKHLEEFELHFFKLNNYIIVWCCKE
ncbi:MAG: 4'-phosphopantetheinyl transferase superfamily protein [Bacteroidales bacterium]|nr:MAG: 4'-phosphopantetheinyl transferase superfamily protein [Bacteroidales bacterium]